MTLFSVLMDLSAVFSEITLGVSRIQSANGRGKLSLMTFFSQRQPTGENRDRPTGEWVGKYQVYIKSLTKLSTYLAWTATSIFFGLIQTNCTLLLFQKLS